MADPFSSFARAPGPPYTRAVALVESADEIEVTAALYVNVVNVLVQLVMADSDTPIWMSLEGPKEHPLRVRKVLDMGGYTTMTFGDTNPRTVARLVGLY